MNTRKALPTKSVVVLPYNDGRTKLLLRNRLWVDGSRREGIGRRRRGDKGKARNYRLPFASSITDLTSDAAAAAAPWTLPAPSKNTRDYRRWLEENKAQKITKRSEGSSFKGKLPISKINEGG